ncbi:hypothetical protein J6590_089731 [Homalodisca vitripennis]|nr:hypothetical protein J6590_089731 [Homalodisca vitripennis]
MVPNRTHGNFIEIVEVNLITWHLDAELLAISLKVTERELVQNQVDHQNKVKSTQDLIVWTIMLSPRTSKHGVDTVMQNAQLDAINVMLDFM